MKKLFLLFLLLPFVCHGAFFDQKPYFIANDSAGIYKTFEDFQKGYLLHSMPVHKSCHTIWPQGFFIHKDIELKTPETSMVVCRDNIWGYVDHKDRLIRVFNHRHFMVLCDKGMVIYIIYSPTSVAYYFSKDLHEPIYHLNQHNLLKVFADNPTFCFKVKNTPRKYYLFWDDRNDMYLLNELLAT
jgi:hypothetical protein